MKRQNRTARRDQNTFSLRRLCAWLTGGARGWMPLGKVPALARRTRDAGLQNFLSMTAMPRRVRGKMDLLSRAVRSSMETLEPRVLLSGNTFFVNDNWKITNNTNTPALDAGDTVSNGNSGDDGSIVGLLYGTDAFKTVGDALASGLVANGDTVVVVSGTYNEVTLINKSIFLEGWTAYKPSSSLTSTLDSGTYEIGAANVTVSGFRVIDMTSFGGIHVDSGATGFTISGNTFSAGDTAVVVAGGSGSVTGNSISTSSEGVVVSGGSATITNTFTSVSSAIDVQGGTAAITGNTFTTNGTDLTVGASGSVSSVVSNAFSGTTYIDNQAIAAIDATANTFGGAAVSSANLSQAYGVEDKIKDGLDYAGRGHVRLQAGKVFVAHSSETATSGAISRGVNAAAGGNTIYVQEGSYSDGVLVNKNVTILGANSGNAGAGTRGAETTIVVNNSVAAFTVVSSSVTLDGLYIEGDNSAAGLPVQSGEDANALYGVLAAAPVSHLTVQNSIIKHFAIGFRGDGTASPVGNNLITRNLFDSIGVYDFGYAITIRENFYADIVDNTFTRVYTGIHALGFYNASPSGSWTISGNNISAYANGIWVNSLYQNGTQLSLDHNTLVADSSTHSVANNIGLLVTTLQDNVGISLTTNSITGFDYGVVTWNTPTTNTLTINNTTTIANSKVAGVLATSQLSFNPIGTTAFGEAAPSTINITSASITGNTGVGVKVEATGTNSATVHITGSAISGNGTAGVVANGNASVVTLANSSVSGFATGIDVAGGKLQVGSGVSVASTTTGVRISGAAAAITGNTLSDLSLTGQSGQYIALSNSALNGQEINGTAVSFDGATGGTNVLADNYTLEDKITHALDDSAPVSSRTGFIRVDAGDVYVTTSSGSIQRGIDAATSGDTIHVAAGTFKENLNIAKSVTIEGANLGISGTTSRATETVVMTNGNASAVINVTAAGVTLDGLTINGDDTSLSGATLYSGADANTAYGVRASAAASNLVVRNSIIENSFIGVRGDGAGYPSAATGGVITRNWFHDIGNFDFGYAVTLRTNFYADVTDNLMTDTWTGIHTAGMDQSNGGTWTFSGNEIHAFAAGIWHNSTYGAGTGLTISGNQISAETGAVADNIGIFLSAIHNAAGVTVTGNSITGTARGMLLWDTGTSPVVSIGATNSISAATSVGILITNNMASSPVGTTVFPAPAATTVNITGLKISSAGTGIQVDGTGTAPITVNVSGVDVVGATAGISASGPSANLTVAGANIHGSATGVAVLGGTAAVTGNTFAGNGIDVKIGASGNVSSLATNALTGATYIDNQAAAPLSAVTNTFNGTAGSALTLSQAFGVEDRILDGLDYAGRGAVRIQNGNVFVTQLSESTTAGAISRGVNAAASGDTLHVSAGTFTDNVQVNKPLTIDGDSQATTTIVPSFSGADTGGGSLATGSSNVFLIQANDVTIAHLTVDGNNSLLPSGDLSNGVDVDARNGIITDHTLGVFNNLDVHNVTVKNIFLRGIYASSGGTFSFTNNTVDNVAGDPASIAIFNFGGSGLIQGNTVSRANDAIAANWSTGTQFKNNTITLSGSGIHTDNSNGPDLIDSNSVSAGTPDSYGIFVFVPYTPITVSNNTVLDVDVGLGLFGGMGGSATFSHNTVNLNDRANSTGVVVSTDTFGYGQMNASATLDTNNDISHAGTGIFIQQLPTATATVTISGNSASIHDNATGIDIEGGSATISTNSIHDNDTGIHLGAGAVATVLANTFANNTLDLQVDSGATLSALQNNSFSGTQYIDNRATLNVDATSNAFSGVAASALTLGQAYAVEDRISDALDYAGRGHVRIQSGHVFVTQLSETTTAGAIQRGIDVANSGDTVHVTAGTFIDSLDINKALTLEGANAGISGTVARGPETIIRPSASNPDPYSSTAEVVVYVSSSNVTIDGFTVDGDNLALTSAVNLNGANIDATEGIASYEGVGNIHIINNVIRNTSYSGVDFDNYANGAPTSNNTISHNLIDNLGGGGYRWGVGVILYDNFYAQVTDNIISNARLGIQTGNFYAANPGPAASISNNQISVTRLGIFYNLAYSGASPFTLSGNDITAIEDLAEIHWEGIAITSLQSAVNVTISNNTIDGSGTTRASTGYTVWNTPTTANLTISGGSVSGVDNGVWINNYEGYNSNAAFTHATIDGVNISARQIGVYVLDSASNTNGSAVAATITGNTQITTGHLGTAVKVEGSDASATITNNTSSIHGNAVGIDVVGGSATISANHLYDNTIAIRFSNGGSGSVSANNFAGTTDNGTDLFIAADAGAVSIGSGNSFAGNTFYIDDQSTQSYDLSSNSTSFDESNNFRIEDKMHHRIDTDLSLATGLITWVAGKAYVTSAGTDHSIQRGIDAVAGGTLNVEAGSYSENVNVNKSLTVLGAGSSGSGTNLANPGGNALTISASGVTVQGLRITGTNSGNGIYFDSALANTTLTDITSTGFANALEIHNSAVLTDLSLDQVTLSNSTNGLRVATTGKVNGLIITNSHFDNNDYGWETYANSSSTTNQNDFTNVSVSSSTFNNNQFKGLYAEKLNNATLTGVVVNNSGSGNDHPNGINLNLKYGTYSNLVIAGSSFDSDGTGVANGTAITIDGRNDGSYASNPASISGVTLQDLTFTGSSPIALSIGDNTSGVTLSGVQISGTGLGLAYWSTAGGLNLADTSFAGTLAGYVVNSSPFTVDATQGATFNGFNPGAGSLPADLASYYATADKIADGVDVSGWGQVMLQNGHVFVTPGSFFAPLTTAASIQRGIAVASSGDTVHVKSGTYINEVDVNKAITLQGDGAATTTISGPKTGASSTVRVSASNATVKGFTITREGNNTTDWATNAKTAGLSVQGLTVNNVLITENIFTANRTGIDLNNVDGITVYRNIIDDNRTGIVVRNQVTNTTVSENFIDNNWTDGFLFLDGGLPSLVTGSAFTHNHIDGNWYGQIEVRTSSGGPKPFAGNFLGTTLNTTNATGGEPGYGALIPIEFGGSAVPPGGAYAVKGAGNPITFSPWLTSGADTSPAFGFQPDLSSLSVDIAGNASVNEGATYILNLSPSNPGSADISGWTVDWGDGSLPTVVTGNPASITHTYADGPNNYSISAIATTTEGTVNANTVAVAINNVPPTATISGASSVDEGSSYTLTIGNPVDPGTDAVTTYIIHWGDTTSTTISATDLTAALREVQHTYADGPNNYNITIDLTDEDGTFTNAANALGITVNNVAPTVLISGASSVNEGSPYTLTIGNPVDPGTDAVTTYIIHWGDTTSTTISAADLTAALREVQHTYADGPNNYNITVDLIDEDGTFTDAANALGVTVNNVPPTLSISGASSVNEAATYTLNLFSNDPGADAISQWTINWGDGPVQIVSGNPASVTHIYADGPNNYTILATATDEDGTYAAGNTVALTVNNVPPTISATNPTVTVNEGSLATNSGSFGDVGTDTITLAASVGDIVDNGDGTWSWSYTPADGPDNSTIVTITATDSDGAQTSTQFSLVVNNVAPTLSISGAPSVNEGSTYTLNLFHSDPGADTISQWTITWGDGNTQVVTGSPASVTHIYADGTNNYTISATATDEDGTYPAGNTVGVTVNNVAPTLASNLNVSAVTENGFVTLSGTLTDPGVNDTFTLTINWGAGENVQVIALGSTPINAGGITWNPGTRAFTVTHQYLDDNPTGTASDLYALTVSATDNGALASNLVNLGLTVNNAPPTNVNIAIGSTTPGVLSSGTNFAAVYEGTVINLNGSFSDVGTQDGHTYNWSVIASNGEVITAGTGVNFSFTPINNNPAGANATYTVTFTVTDDDTGTASSSPFVFTVVDKAPTIALTGNASTNEGSVYTLNLGAITDPGQLDAVTGYEINWGDGTVEDFGSLVSAPNVSPANTVRTHVYANGPASYTIRVALNDNDGLHTNAGTLGLSVVNVAPTAIFSNFGDTDEGSSTTVRFTGQADASSVDTAAGFHYAFDFNNDGMFDSGDGSYFGSGTSSLIAVPSSYLFIPGSHTVKGRIIDQNNGFTDYTTTFNVDNVAPTVSVPATFSAGTGIPFTIAGSFSDPGLDGPWTGTVDFGDGTGVQTLTVNSVTKSFNLSHTYASAGSYPVTVHITDHPSAVPSLTGNGSMNVTVADTTLQVINFTQTASGFNFGFNRAININDIKLYGNGIFTAPLTVTGPSGIISGSAIWDPATTSLRWVKSGGILGVGNYTVSLASGISGNNFHDATGGALDGDGNGTAGDAFVRNATVASSAARVLSIPDFARGQGQAVIVNATGVQTGSTGLPVFLNDGTGVQSVTFTLNYDPTLLTLSTSPTDFEIPDNWDVTVNLLSAGHLRVVVYSTDSSTLGSGLQKVITFKNASVPVNAPYGASQLITLTGVLLNENLVNPIPVVADFAVHKAADLGDVTGDGSVGGADASKIAQVVVGINSGFTFAPLTDPLVLADLTGDGTVSGLDASAAAQIFTIPGSQPQVPTAAGSGTTISGIDPVLRTGNGAASTINVIRGGNFTTTVSITDDANGLYAADLIITYDTARLDLANAGLTLSSTLSSLGWGLSKNVTDSTGTIRVSIYSQDFPLTAGPASLLNLAFTVPANAPVGTSTLNVVNPNQIGGSRLNEGGLVISTDLGSVTIAPNAIAARKLFYKGSAFDTTHDNATAADKVALLPGGSATLANVSSYSNGINGLFVDIAGGVGALSSSDFLFKVGNSNDTTTWTILGAAASINVRPGAGVGGSNRVEITFADHAIQKEWLQVTVLGNANTGLASDDVFYFGNAIGKSSNNPSDGKVTASDEIGPRANPGTGVGIANAFDYNKDNNVDSVDESIAHANVSNFLNALILIAPTTIVTGPVAPTTDPATTPTPTTTDVTPTTTPTTTETTPSTPVTPPPTTHRPVSKPAPTTHATSTKATPSAAKSATSATQKLQTLTVKAAVVKTRDAFGKLLLGWLRR